MANKAATPSYIRYTFPAPSATPALGATLVVAHNSSVNTSQPVPLVDSSITSLDLAPAFDPDFNGIIQPPSATSERVRDWISHNTGEDGGDTGDWKDAGEDNAKSRRKAYRAGARIKRETSSLDRTALSELGGRPALHDTEHSIKLNSDPSLQSTRAAVQDPNAMTATTDPAFHQARRHDHEIRKYMRDVQIATEPGSWQAYAEVPTSNEVMYIPPDESVPRNQIEGAWKTTEDYLEAHYLLLREDAVFPLKSAVHQLRDYPTMQEDYFNGSLGIYNRVHIVGLTCDIRGIALRVAFSLNRVGKRVKWEQSKRLIPGMMVALTPAANMFQSECIIAIVAARALRGVQMNPPEIDLYLPRSNELEINPSIEWVMVEERGAYFEASRYVLTALQKLSRESFPLQEHIVKLAKKVDIPFYIKQNPILDMSTVFEAENDTSYKNLDVIKDWPKKPKTSLDTSQLTALHRILAKKLAIIQGPPGTGKTHVSVVALQTMLANGQPGDAPIIVACQTNHALDQLLRHVAVFEKQFARLGGRSKDQGIVKERALYQLRKAKNRLRTEGGLKATSSAKMRRVTNTIADSLGPLATGSKLLLDPQTFKKVGLLTDIQCQSLEQGDQEWVQHASDHSEAEHTMEQWLGKQLQPVKRDQHPDDLLYDYEDADMEPEYIQELEAEGTPIDGDIDGELHGQYYPINENYTGKCLSQLSDFEIEALLKKTQNLYRIPSKQRGSVFAYLQRQLKLRLVKAIREESQQYNELALERRVGVWEQDLTILRKQKLVGMTTTGLSKYRPLISALSPRVVLIEEAAETIEAPVTVACVPSLEHLIMVGDHQQLRPQCSVKTFEGSPFNLNVSLFERMVLNSVEYNVIRRQRRMIPEIRRLLEPIYGAKTIKDHEVVKSAEHRPPVPGMAGVNSYFFCHDWQETRDENMSACNVQEAKMLVAFFDYLVLNGVPATDVTVMTFYNGQRKAIQKAFRKHPNHRGSSYNIATVDSYQGEENDVVLLSLTRSNENHNIGFLNVVNRICVALSRAKRGFYLFGNAEMLCSESSTWADVASIMWGKKGEKCPEPLKRIGFYLPLKCENHGRITLVEEVDDFTAINGGGCTFPCGGFLPCGHPCLLNCHSFAHKDVLCSEPCTKTVECGHACGKQCSEECQCDICNDEEVERIESIGLSLQQIDATGRAMSRAYGLLGTKVFDNRTRGIETSSPAAWKDYAINGVEAHDRKLMANPHRTFSEWDASTAKQSESWPSQPSHNVPVTPVDHPLRSTTSDLVDAVRKAYEYPNIEVLNTDHEPDLDLRRSRSIDLIDFE